ncbi:MAG: protein translocase subunit SecD [Gemmatimonas sp.]|nr:protein translocase subunit SecD [Gemmatimonas sp.]
MFKDLRARVLLIVALALVSVWVLYDRGITLGLDLQGGTHLALEVRDEANALTAEQREDAIDRALRVIRTRVDELGVAEPGIQKSGRDRIVVELPGATREEQQRAKDVISRSAFLQFQIVQPATELTSVLPRIDRAVAAVADELEVAPTASDTTVEGEAGAPGLGLFETVDSAAVDSAAVDSAAVDSAAVDSAAVDSAAFDSAAVDSVGAVATADSVPPDTAAGAEGEQLFSARLAPGGAGGEGVFLVLNEDVPFLESALARPEVQQTMPRGVELRWGLDSDSETTGVRSLYLLDEEPLITGEYLTDAQAQRDLQLGQPIVLFEFNRRGGRIFERGTGANVGNLMAIVLDEQVFSAPIIQSQIGTRGQIEMAGSGIEAASDLALVLRAGALPAPIDIVEERSVGPSLGQDSIDSGQLAGIIGLALVVVIMIGYYRVSGAMAVVALALYVLFVMAGLAGINAALTLPGIAGLILSIGMAVDANVLIFERIREELAVGRSPRIAVNEGFANALSAIVDAQLTTLLTAFVLFEFGTGAVRGFAVTLAIGIVASMFSAIFVTRTFFMLYLERRVATDGVSI